MTTVAAPAAGRGAPSARSLLHRARPWLVLVVLVALAATLGALGLSSTGGSLDPRSAAPAGTRALAALLAGQGVAVTVSPARTALPGGTTVVAFPANLSDRELAALPREAAGGTVLLIAPGPAEARAVDPGVSVGPAAPTEVRPATCPLPEARSAGTVLTGGPTFRGAGTSCYPAAAGGTLFVTRVAGARLVLAGSGDPFTNAHLATAGDAALTVGLLADHPRLRWLLPGPVPSGRSRATVGTLTGLLPRRLVDAFWELCLAVLLLALARGRRLGPPVGEPLPVRVPATETVLGRARLYESARARGKAAAALRAGTRDRLAGLLGLAGRSVPPAALTGTVADRSGRDTGAVAALLYGAGRDGEPADDAALIRLAADLQRLEEQVRPT